MAGRAKQFCRWSAFHHLAGIHDRNAVRDARHNAKIMRDQQNAKAKILLQFGQKSQDLRLHCHIKRGGRFIGNQQFRIAHQRHGDHDALTKPA